MMSDNIADNKKIAKNTMLLYVRMLFIMAVQLFTSRVVLNTLGVVDYGIYNVVGGIVAMFAFLNGAIITSTQRYLTYELGKKDEMRLKAVFTSSLQIHAMISFAIFVLGETIGLWFLYNKMVIPDERMHAAVWVFQLSVVTMIIQIMSAPYNSAIIAHEKMEAFAFISIVEVVFKLLIAYLLLLVSYDKLIFYAILITVVQIAIRLLYTKYCNHYFIETKPIAIFDKKLLKEIGAFAGWNLTGSIGVALCGQGLNLLINMFFGPAVNAARAISVQVETVLENFSNNFLVAVSPQITKLCAQGQHIEMVNLISRSSRMAFLLLFSFSMPIILETSYILKLWLNIVPDYTVSFLRILLMIAIVNAVARPLVIAVSANGEIKRYQLVISSILLCVVPLSYLWLRLGGDPVSVYIVHFTINIIIFGIRLYFMKTLLSFPIWLYAKDVVLKCSNVLLTSIIISYILKTILPNIGLFPLLVCFCSLLLSMFLSFTLGMTTSERHFFMNKAYELIQKAINRS